MYKNIYSIIYNIIPDAANAIQRTSASVDCLKGQLGIRAVSSRQDNEVRKQHHQTIEQLRANQKVLLGKT